MEAEPSGGKMDSSTRSASRSAAPGETAILGKLHALHAQISVERDSRTSPYALAQPLSALAGRDLLRCKDAADRFSGILGIRMAGAQQSLAISEMDGGDGTLRPPQAEECLEMSREERE